MITYERVTVTPALAKKWLAVNSEHNRRPKTAKIPAYARDMLLGHWNSDTGETIKFDVDGVLIDGQNRLRAVISADVPIDFDVARGLPNAAMQVLDSGAARTGADALRISGVAASSTRTAAIVLWVLMWDHDDFLAVNTAYRPTNTEIHQAFEQRKGEFDAAARRGMDCQNRGLGGGAAAGVAHYLFDRLDMEMTHQFFDQYVSGANLPDKSSVLLLRNRIARVRVDRLTRGEQLALFIRAWNAFRAGKPIAALIIANGDLTNSNFPMPK